MLPEGVRRARRDWWSDWWLDVRHAVRSLARTPGISAAVIVMLALGIGANAAMFDVLDRVVLRAPPHLADPSTLVRVAITTQRTGFPEQTRTLGPFAEVTDYERGVSAFRAVAAYALPRPVSLGDSGGGEIRRSSVTARLFEVLGTRPMAGRAIDTSDVAGPPVAVISYNLWRRQLLGSSTAIGRDLVLGGIRYTVVGIMPRGFSGAEANAADVWTLVDHEPPRFGGTWRTTRNTYWLEIVARLRSRDAGLRASWQIAAVRREAGVRRRGVRESVALGSIVPGRLSSFDRPAVRLSIAVSVVCALLLVIAVANTANLLLVRAMARLRELAVRVALGAGRGRLIRYLMIESGVLALVSGVAASVVTLLAGRGLRSLLFPGYAWNSSSLGLVSGAFAAAAALLAALAAGLVPALLAGRSDVLGSLRGGIRQGRGARGRVRSSLVAAQLAVTMVLLAGSGLFARSLARATDEDHGVAMRELLCARLSLEGDDAARLERLAQVRATVQRVPGVRDVTVISDAPMRGLRFASMRVPGWDTTFTAMQHDVAPDFLRVTGLRLLAGRGIGEDDRAGTERVVMIDSMLARQTWPGESPIGHCLAGEGAGGCLRVIGVVAHVRSTGLTDDHTPQVFLPLAQTTIRSRYDLLVRASDDPDAIVEPVWRAIATLVPDYRRVRVQSYRELLAPQLAPWRVGMILSVAAAGLAVLLSTIGAYAVLSFAVRQRRHEFGVRRALGAGAAHVLRLVAASGAAAACSGVMVGLLAFLALGKFVTPLLYHVPARDPVVAGAAAALLVAAAMGAALAAGALALRVPPTEALQAD